MTWRPAEKIFCNLRYKDGITTKHGEGAELWYSQDPQPCAGNPQTEGQSQLQGFFPRREVTKPHLRGPTLRVLHWEDKPQNTQGQQGSLSGHQGKSPLSELSPVNIFLLSEPSKKVLRAAVSLLLSIKICKVDFHLLKVMYNWAALWPLLLFCKKSVMLLHFWASPKTSLCPYVTLLWHFLSDWGTPDRNKTWEAKVTYGPKFCLQINHKDRSQTVSFLSFDLSFHPSMVS